GSFASRRSRSGGSPGRHASGCGRNWRSRMPDELSLLERRMRSFEPAPDAFEDLIERRGRRKVRRERRRRVASAVAGFVVFGAGLFLLIKAVPHGGSTGPGSTSSPIGIAPPGLGSLETIRAFSESDVVAVADHGLIATSDGG